MRFLPLPCLAAVAACATTLVTAQVPQYVAVETSVLFGREQVDVVDVNDHGQLIGNQLIGDNEFAPLYWNQGRSYELPLLPNLRWASVTRLNNNGLIIGANYDSNRTPTGTLWSSGLAQSFVELTGTNAVPTAVNDAGDLAGWIVAEDPQVQVGFTWFDATFTPFFENYRSTLVSDINASRVVVGSAQQNSSQAGRSFRRIDDDDLLFGLNGNTSSNAYAINASAQIAGAGRSTLFTGTHAFRYTLAGSTGQMEDLHPAGASESVGRAIAPDGSVYGDAAFPDRPHADAMLLDGANSVRLADQTIGADNARLASVERINQAGWMIVEEPWDSTGATPVATDYLLIPRTTATSAFTNLSVRSELTSAQPLIVGTTTAGSGNDVLIRGIGPGLAPYLDGNTPVAGDPAAAVYNQASALVAENGDWVTDQTTTDAVTTAQAFPLTEGSTDAMLTHALDGPTTVHITNSGDAGVGLVEIYHLDNSAPANRLTNLSARYEVGTGQNILIAGFIVSGTGPKTVLIRGVGPGLTQHGVDGVLANPEITLHNQQGDVVAENDDWNANLGSVFEAVGAFSLEEGSADAALVLPLWPGLYTVHLRGVDSTTGQGLIEIYDLDL